MTDKIMVMVTCRSQAEAKKIARAVVEARLAACANVMGSPVRSIYWWKGKVETAKEVLVLIKTTRKRFSALEREIRRVHSYDTPEIVAVPVVAGSFAYLRWIEESVLRPGRDDNRK
ncbi:MAG TPA: divalent-cation tolerance protein CutA [Candidatus Acidoferrales bacterium]|nr:divalent-cation tolerance protein CutA [Candidatus Acidoferrales bacterium]